MYMPHTVTIYTEFEDPTTFQTTTNITVLPGVFLDESKGANVKASGMEGADAAVLYIPLDVEAIDGTTKLSKRFVGWREYERAEKKNSLWSLDVNGHTFFVKGKVVEPGKDFSYLNSHYDNVYRVTKVDVKDFGSAELRHIEVGGA